MWILQINRWRHELVDMRPMETKCQRCHYPIISRAYLDQSSPFHISRSAICSGGAQDGGIWPPSSLPRQFITFARAREIYAVVKVKGRAVMAFPHNFWHAGAT